MEQKEVKLTLYRWAGRKFFFEIRSTCEECDQSVQVIRKLLETRFSNLPVTFEVKNWLDHLFECLWHRGWHAPVILVGGKVFSQGVIPDSEKLSRSIWQKIREVYPTCPICQKVIFEDNYSDHRHRETRERIVRFIQMDHPDWRRSDGICPECVEFYEEKMKSGGLIA
ncbi:MAG: hypothetical protein ACRD1R_18820 [Acidobacteriota bacterium]